MLSDNPPLIITVKSGGDLFWRYVQPVSVERGKKLAGLKVRWFSADQLTVAEDIYLEWKETDADDEIRYSRQKLTYLEHKDGICYFEIVGNAVPLSESRVFTVDYKSTVYLKVIDENELLRYQQKVSYENMREERSMNHRICVMALKETSENRVVLRFMQEINNKLDDIIRMFAHPPDEEGVIVARGVGINVRGIIFYCDKDIPENIAAFTELTAGNGEDHFTFASIVNIRRFAEAENDCFYEGVFSDISEGIKDLIIRFVFSCEREMIKDMRDR
ncbi:MAG: hypothetical protein LBH05_06860 [Deferribacteraceae bacterium]|jgi:hypothetical protein|nr:hypothetical protein [Deferribacteraceae bacterium]